MHTKAQGTSMFPLIRPGADIVIDNRRGDAYVPGDIVAYLARGGRIVVHRIITGARDRSYFVKGDNNRVVDRPVEARRIVGRVVRIVYKSYAIELQTPLSRTVSRFIARVGRAALSRRKFAWAEYALTYLAAALMSLWSVACYRLRRDAGKRQSAR